MRERVGPSGGSIGGVGGGGEAVRVSHIPLKVAVLAVQCRSEQPAGGEFA